MAAEAAKTLRNHPGAAVTTALVRAFSDPERERFVREAAGTSLMRRRDPAAVPALVDVLERAATAPDVALLPIGGHYVMDPLQAAKAARMLEADAVVPIHWGTFPVLAGTPAELAGYLDGTGIEVAALDIGVPV